MPNSNGTINFYQILLFIVPGLVIFYVRSNFITGRQPSHSENILTYLVLSVIYYGLTIPLIEQALTIREPWIARAFVWIALTLIGPCLFGALSRCSSAKRMDELGRRQAQSQPCPCHTCCMGLEVCQNSSGRPVCNVRLPPPDGVRVFFGKTH